MNHSKRILYKFMSIVLAIAIGFSAVLTVAQPAQTAPNDPITGSAVAFDAAAPDPINYNSGDWGVANERGAATYTVPLPVPPGRNGMAPDLTLRYSSRSPLRGGVAVGWTLDVAAIYLDRAEGQEDFTRYRASLPGASGRLVEVPDVSPYPEEYVTPESGSGSESDTTVVCVPGDNASTKPECFEITVTPAPPTPVPATVTAYRIEGDTSFTRFFHTNARNGEWLAMSTDGVRHYFTADDLPGDMTFGGTRWHLTRTVDPFGNTIRYFYELVNVAHGGRDMILTRIEYTSNANAGLSAHAKVEFNYAPLETCPNTFFPIGAAHQNNLGFDSPGYFEGARRLTAVKTYVRDAPGATWRISRNSTFGYDMEALGYDADVLRCEQHGAPLRYLTQISVAAYDQDGQVTHVPPTTFEYGRTQRTFEVENSYDLNGLPASEFDFLPYGMHGETEPGGTGTAHTLWQDLTGDGLLDRLAVDANNETCNLVWQEGILHGDQLFGEQRRTKLPTTSTEWVSEPYIDNYFEQYTVPVQGEWSIQGPGKCTLNRHVLFKAWTNTGQSSGNPIAVTKNASYMFTDADYDGTLDVMVPIAEKILILHPSYVGKAATLRGFGRGSIGQAEYSLVAVPTADGSVPIIPGGSSLSSSDESGIQWFTANIPQTVDLDGDGFKDFVHACTKDPTPEDGNWDAYSTTQCQQYGDLRVRLGPVDLSRPRWQSQFIDVPQITWSSPSFNAGFEHDVHTNGDGSIDLTGWLYVVLRDVNGDGLQDLVVWDTQDGEHFPTVPTAYMNFGSGFRSTPMVLDHFQPAEETRYFIQTQNGSHQILDGSKHYARRFIDVDGDGWDDVVNLEGTPTVRYSFGDGFGPELPLPALRDAERRVVTVNGTWRLESDWLDINGDGLGEPVRWAADGKVHVLHDGQLTAAPRSLIGVENGRGMRTEIQYAASHDPGVVTHQALQSPDQLPGPRSPFWVASSITVSGGFNTELMTTDYRYAAPVYAARYGCEADGTDCQATIPSRFLGFGEVTVEAPNADAGTAGKRVVSRYDYDTATGESHVIEQKVYSGDSLHSYTTLTYEKKPLFDGVVFFTHSTRSEMRICLNGQTDEACATDNTNLHWQEQTWLAHKPAGCSVTDACMYTSETSSEGDGNDTVTPYRTTTTKWQVRYGQDSYHPNDYRVLLEESMIWAGIPETTPIPAARQRNTYDDAGLSISTEIWQNEDTVAKTERGFDPATGNLLTMKRPIQVAAGSDLVLRNGFDVHRLFVTTVTNELGHQVHTEYDIATGTQISAAGPNSVEVNGQQVWYREEWSIDGLGRIWGHKISVDDAELGYRLIPVASYTYDDDRFATDGQPVVRIEMQRRDLQDEVWLVPVQTKVDGLSRIVEVLEGGALTKYAYDGAGRMSSVEIDSLASGSDGYGRDAYHYKHDALGRQTEFMQPDGAALLTSYDGLAFTAQEKTADGSGSTKTRINDVYGRLVELQEHGPTGMLVTRYAYDLLDNLSRIVDADGNETRLEHDWTGNRTTITRGTRTWSYDYDLNGNVVAEHTPLHSTTSRYDVLDRVVDVTYEDLAVSNASGPIAAAAQLSSLVGNMSMNPDGQQDVNFVPALQHTKSDTDTNQHDSTGISSAKIYLPVVLHSQAESPIVPAATTNANATLYLPSIHHNAMAEQPLTFVPNQGQTPDEVLFQVKSTNHSLYFTAQEVVFSAAGMQQGDIDVTTVRLHFDGANADPVVEGIDQLSGVVNFVHGEVSNQWVQNVPTYAGIAYRSLYPGVDLYYGSHVGTIKSEFVVQPGADPSQIQMVYNGVHGMQLRSDGALVLQTDLGELVESAPYVYQVVDGMENPISASYVVAGERVTFDLDDYDPSLPLIIDPELVYATYLGGNGDDSAIDNGPGFMDMAVDDQGNLYLATTTTTDPFPGATNVFGGSQDVLVAKINADRSLAYATYLGGSGKDGALSIALDSNGNVYVSGATQSADFPATGGYDTSFNGGSGPFFYGDAFVAKLDANGQLVAATFIGGSGIDTADGVAVDSNGVYVTGRIEAAWNADWADFVPPAAGADSSYNQPQEAYVAKLDLNLTSFMYFTYMGRSTASRDIAVDAQGAVYIAGLAYKDTSWQPTHLYGDKALHDAFVAKLSPDGMAFAYSTILAGSDSDWIDGIAIDASGNAFVTGQGSSFDFMDADQAFESVHNNYRDAFVAKLNAGGDLAYITYLGGQASEGRDIAVDAEGNAYVTGYGHNDFPVTEDSIQPCHAGTFRNAFMTILDPQGSQLLYSTCMGGSGPTSGKDEGLAIALRGDQIYVAGSTWTNDFPVTSDALQPNAGDNIGPKSDIFVAQLDLSDLTPITLETQPVERTITYTYDQGPNGIGRLSHVDLGFGHIAYEYEARGLVSAETRSVILDEVLTLNTQQRVERQYNALGATTLSTWDDGQQWQITYDERGLVDTVQWYDPQTATWQAVADYERNLAGLPTWRGSSYNQERYYSYDVLGRPKHEEVFVNGVLIANRDYTYTGSGDLATLTGMTSGISADATYTYDSHHRLLSASGPHGYSGIFSYSPSGNLLTANVTWDGSSETRNVSYEYGTADPQAVDRLANSEGGSYATFSYDDAGNMTMRSGPDGDLSLEWDGIDRLRYVDGPNGLEIYYYDTVGSRMLAVNPDEGVRLWFAESETHFDTDGAKIERYLHLSGDGPTLARVKDGAEIELQYADALQNLMFSLDASGNVVASFLYGPFGEVLYAEGADEHRRQFNGKEHDSPSGLRYYGYRYYDPLALRWNSADPLYRFAPEVGFGNPQELNLYAFSLNNPVRYYDPDGLAADNYGANTCTGAGTIEPQNECLPPPSEPNCDPHTNCKEEIDWKKIANDCPSNMTLANCAHAMGHYDDQTIRSSYDSGISSPAPDPGECDVNMDCNVIDSFHARMSRQEQYRHLEKAESMDRQPLFKSAQEVWLERSKAYSGYIAGALMYKWMNPNHDPQYHDAAKSGADAANNAFSGFGTLSEQLPFHPSHVQPLQRTPTSGFHSGRPGQQAR